MENGKSHTANGLSRRIAIERKVGQSKDGKSSSVLATGLKPDAIGYSIDQNGMPETKELTCLRLILFVQDGYYYVFLDFPKGNMLRKTEIPIREDKKGTRHLEDEDAIQFIKGALGREDLAVFSFWTA